MIYTINQVNRPRSELWARFLYSSSSSCFFVIHLSYKPVIHQVCFIFFFAGRKKNVQMQLIYWRTSFLQNMCEDKDSQLKHLQWIFCYPLGLANHFVSFIPCHISLDAQLQYATDSRNENRNVQL